MNVASIDIGSNTVLLLIAEVKNDELRTIKNFYKAPRISKGLVKGKVIKKNSIKQLITILQDYKKEIDKFDCRKIFIVGTNAFRIASNRKEILEEVKKHTGFQIKIIDGHEEAKLSYLGASLTLPGVKEKVVIDIGGGSTEVIYGKNKSILFRNSFQTGVVSLTEMFLSEFPYGYRNFISISEFLSQTFDELLKNIPKQLPTIVVAGTPTTLSGINQNLKKYNEEKIEGSILKLTEIQDILSKMKKLNGKQIREKFGEVVYGREDVILAGTLILVHLMKTLALDRIYVSNKGLRYGNIVNNIN